MAFNHLWGISLRHVALYCGSGYRLYSGGRKRLKKMGELESGDENKGPFPCLVNRSASCACPPLFFVFIFLFHANFLSTTEPGPRPAIDGFCVVVCQHMGC